MSMLSAGHECAGAWLLACPVCRNAHDSLEICDPVSLCTEKCVSVYVRGTRERVCVHMRACRIASKRGSCPRLRTYTRHCGLQHPVHYLVSAPVHEQCT